MNITEVIYLTIDVIEILLPKDSRIFNWYDQCVNLVCRHFNSLSRLVLYYTTSFAHEIISFLLTLLSLTLIILLLSFIKSIQPRYRLSDDHDNKFNPYVCTANLNQTLAGRSKRNIQISPENRARFKSSLRVNSNNLQQPIVTKFLKKLKEESCRIHQLCHPALTNVNLQSIQQQLSWSYSQPDMENLGWLNQTLQTLWPSIRTLLYKFCLIDLIQPRKRTAIDRRLNKIDTKKEQSKMSVFISSRRKLDFLQRAKNFRNSPRYSKFFKRSALTLITYCVRLFLIYTRQFVMDSIVYSFNQRANKVSPTNIQRLELDLNGLMSKISSKRLSLNTQVDSKSWAGFDLNSGNRDKIVKLKRKVKSASQETACNQPKRVLYKSTTTLIKPTNSVELWRKYKNLIKKFVSIQNKIKNRGTSIDKIRLGDSIPTVNAIKYLDGSSDYPIESNHNPLYSLASDDQNMRFMIELSFESDKHFEFRASSIPVLGRARVIGISFQLRLLVTLNHTVTKLRGGNLEIFETPDDILFPAVNHIQVTLIDVPRLDWHLVRAPRKNQNSCKDVADSPNQSKLKFLMHQVNQYLDPIHLLNHNYFKFITHSIIYLALKWFQPFEIKLSPSLYVKTTC